MAVKIQPTLEALPQHPRIQVYFNYNQSHVYTDPYRQVTRLGDNLEEQIIQLINAAEDSIDIAVQAIDLPLIAQALVNQKQAGVQIRWIAENSFIRPWATLSVDELERLSRDELGLAIEFTDLIDVNEDGVLSDAEIQSRDIFTLLDRNGIPYSSDNADGSKGSGLMHHKFMVIDAHIVVTGSANFTLSGLHGDKGVFDSFGNSENLLVIDSPELATLYTEEFQIMWGDGPGATPDSIFGVRKPYRPVTTVPVGDAAVAVKFSPDRASIPDIDTSNGVIAQVLSQAQHRIDLALFIFTDSLISKALHQAYQKDVIIQGVIDPEFAYRDYSKTLDIWGLEPVDDQCRLNPGHSPWNPHLTTIGVPALGPTDKLHHKFAVVDDATVITGSHNWSQAANRKNDENVLVIQSSAVAAHFRREAERLAQSATLGPNSRLQIRDEYTHIMCDQITLIEQPGPINVNTAPVELLINLPGIGPVLAERIKQQRPFISIEDLTRVPGIGPEKLAALRDKVVL